MSFLKVRSSDIGRLSHGAQDIFRLEALADDLYALAAPTIQPTGRDYTEGFIRL